MAEIITDILGAQGAVGHPLYGDAQKNGHNQGDGNGNEPWQACHCKNHKVSGHHEDIAVSEIDEAEDAVDQGIAYGNERIGPAKGDAGQALLKKCC